MTDNQSRVISAISNQILKAQTHLEEIGRDMAQAVTDGDISENPVLQTLRAEAQETEAKILALEVTRERFESGDDGRITGNIGATFTLQDKGSKRVLTRTLILSEELGSRLDAITDASPVGQEVINARVGSVITVEVKGKPITFTVQQIAFDALEGIAAD